MCAAGHRATPVLPRAARRVRRETRWRTVRVRRARASPRHRPNSPSTGWHRAPPSAESGRGLCRPAGRAPGRIAVSAYPSSTVVVTTTCGLTNFITPSTSRNSVGRALRMRPAQRLFFERGEDTCLDGTSIPRFLSAGSCPARARTITGEEEPEHQSVRDQEQRDQEGRHEGIGGTHVPGCVPESSTIALIERVEQIAQSRTSETPRPRHIPSWRLQAAPARTRPGPWSGDPRKQPGARRRAASPVRPRQGLLKAKPTNRKPCKTSNGRRARACGRVCSAGQA